MRFLFQIRTLLISVFNTLLISVFNKLRGADTSGENATELVEPFDLNGMDGDCFLHLSSLLDNDDRRRLSQTCQKFRRLIMSRTTPAFDTRRNVIQLRATISEYRISVSTNYFGFAFANETLYRRQPTPSWLSNSSDEPRVLKLTSTFKPSERIEDIITQMCAYWNVPKILLDYYDFCGSIFANNGPFLDTVVIGLLTSLPELRKFGVILRKNQMRDLDSVSVEKWMEVFFRSECELFHFMSLDLGRVAQVERRLRIAAEAEGLTVFRLFDNIEDLEYELVYDGKKKTVKIS